MNFSHEGRVIIESYLEGKEVSVNAVIKDDTIWLTQKSMSELFEVTPQTITRHLANIYEEKELFKDSTCTKIVQVQNEGSRQVKRNIDFLINPSDIA